MFKIDKTMVDNMNQNRSYIVITHKETHRETAPEISAGGPELLESDGQLPQAVRDKARELIQSAQARASRPFSRGQPGGRDQAQAAKEGFEPYEAGGRRIAEWRPA